MILLFQEKGLPMKIVINPNRSEKNVERQISDEAASKFGINLKNYTL